MTGGCELAVQAIPQMTLFHIFRSKPCARLSFCLVALGVSTRCGAVEQANELVFLGGVSGIFDREKNPALAVEYRSKREWATLRPWLAVGWATDGAVFAGGGAMRAWGLGGSWSCAVGFGAGRYDRHEGRDLGSHLEFLTYGEISRRAGERRRFLVRLTHISNGSLADINPGTELLTLGYSMSLP